MIDLLLAMPPDRFLAFLAGALVVNFTPGADFVFASACGISGGPRAGACAGLGAGTGVLWHVALAAGGLSAVMAAHPGALDMVRWAGAGYLLWLAWQAWHAGGVGGARGARSGWAAWRRGVLTNMLNPKPALFMLAFLPQFVTAGPDAAAAAPVWAQIAALGLVFAFTGTLVTVGYGVAAGYAGRAVASRGVMLNRLSAVLFGGLALRLAME